MLKDRKTDHRQTDQQTTHIHGQTDRQIQTRRQIDKDRYR